jgi:hypothetical protein
MCILSTEAKEPSKNMHGQYRIWSHVKPKKETFLLFNNYLGTRFKTVRMNYEGQSVHGYIGCMLRPIAYQKKLIDSDVETFIFHACDFHPNSRTTIDALETEYKKWKDGLNKPITETNVELEELKEYLNSCEYVIKSTIWVDGMNTGYYGIALKTDDYKHKTISSCGKRIEKVDNETGEIIGTWDSIANAAIHEKLPRSNMSLYVKNAKIINGYLFRKIDATV